MSPSKYRSRWVVGSLVLCWGVLSSVIVTMIEEGRWPTDASEVSNDRRVNAVVVSGEEYSAGYAEEGKGGIASSPRIATISA